MIRERVVVTPSPSTASMASASFARRHRGANARVSRLSPARWRMKKTAPAASSDRSPPPAYRSSTPSRPGAASSQWPRAQRMASRGRSWPALAKARIVVSTSIDVLRPRRVVAAAERAGHAREQAFLSALAPLPELLDPVLLVAEHLRRERHRRRHPEVGQRHERHLAPVRRDDVADDPALVAQVRHRGDRLPVPGRKDDLLLTKQPGERRREVDLERQRRLKAASSREVLSGSSSI